MVKQIRLAVVGILAMAGLILLMGEPIEEETWCRVFITTKIAGFALWGATYRLYHHWNKHGLLPDDDFNEM